MNRTTWMRLSAVVTVLALCLSLPGLLPIYAQASAEDQQSVLWEEDHALDELEQNDIVDDSAADSQELEESIPSLRPSLQQPDEAGDFATGTHQPGEGAADPTPGTHQPDEGNTDPTPGTHQPDDGNTDPTPGAQQPDEGNTDPTPGTQQPGNDSGDPSTGPQEPGQDGGNPAPDPQQPGTDGDIPSDPDGAGDVTASDEFDEGDTLPTGTGEEPEEPAEPEEPEPELPEAGLEEPLPPEEGGLIRSNRSVPGYNVFELDSFADLTEALSATSYPSQEHPETSVYILLTGDVRIDQGFTLHNSIEKVTIDGDGRHTLSETNLSTTQVSPNTAEVTFKDLTIVGHQYFGLLNNPHGTHVTYNYQRIRYTGPQLLWAGQSTAHFTDCDIRIAPAGSPAHEVAEIRDVFLHGDNEFRHNSINSVFFLYNGGNLVISDGAKLRINATGDNPYILFTASPQSTLRLEDGASLRIEGTSSQLVANAGLHSIYLGEHATFDWVAHRSGADYISVNNSGGAKDAIYLSEGAAFRVEPNGTPDSRLIRIHGGNVVVGPGASLSLRAVLYSATYEKAPFHLAAGSSLTIGKSATFTMEIGNRNNLGAGLLYFGGGQQSGLFVESDSTVLIRGNKVTGAIYFNAPASSMAVNDPDYLEIVTSGGHPIYFNSADVANPSTLTYTDVQQINYWGSAIDNSYLSGGRPVRRWVAKTGALTITATISGYGNGRLSTELSGDPLDQDWLSTLDAMEFAWSNVRILSAGKIGMEVSADGKAYQGRITAPTMGVPYDQGAVQLRVGQPGSDRAVSARALATPDFHVTPSRPVGEDDVIAVWAEYGYVFHNNPPSSSSGELSLTAPDQIEFGVVTIAMSDTEVPALEPYSLQVRDQRRTGWQVMASFSGFSNADKSLDSTLVVNDVPLQESPRPIAASVGSETVPLEASLRVPGGAADSGAFMGNITWTLVDAP